MQRKRLIACILSVLSVSGLQGYTQSNQHFKLAYRCRSVHDIARARISELGAANQEGVPLEVVRIYPGSYSGAGVRRGEEIDPRTGKLLQTGTPKTVIVICGTAHVHVAHKDRPRDFSYYWEARPRENTVLDPFSCFGGYRLDREHLEPKSHILLCKLHWDQAGKKRFSSVHLIPHKWQENWLEQLSQAAKWSLPKGAEPEESYRKVMMGDNNPLKVKVFKELVKQKKSKGLVADSYKASRGVLRSIYTYILLQSKPKIPTQTMVKALSPKATKEELTDTANGICSYITFHGLPGPLSPEWRSLMECMQREALRAYGSEKELMKCLFLKNLFNRVPMPKKK